MFCSFEVSTNKGYIKSLQDMKTIKTLINGKVETVNVRDFLGMYQILTGPYAMGVVRKDEVL